jgi:hypothetical protein
MDSLAGILNILVDIVFVYLVVFGMNLWLVPQRPNQINKQLDQTLKELELGQLIALTVEVDQNQYLCYNALTKDFVCQGHNLTEIIERFKQRYPDKTAAIYNGDETAVQTLKQQWKDLNENSNSVRSSS